MLTVCICYNTIRKVVYASAVSSRIKLRGYGTSHISKMADICCPIDEDLLIRFMLMSHLVYTLANATLAKA